jgi:hypothetical protein
MNSDRWVVALAATTLVCFTACGNSREETESDVGATRSALIDANAMNANAMNANAMNANGLDSQTLLAPMLASGPLIFSSLSHDARDTLVDPGPNGDLARQLLQYAASCALAPSQSVDFSWTDADGSTWEESDPGLLSLATDWTEQALSPWEQDWVSACLISRVNYLGVTVELSSRGPFPGLNVTAESELEAFPMEEGAFFGNIFTSTPVAYACDDVADDANSEAMDRFCATGYVDASGDVDSCGIIQRLGSCADYCTPLTRRGQFHWLCATTPLDQGWQGLTAAVITVFLP